MKMKSTRSLSYLCYVTIARHLSLMNASMASVHDFLSRADNKSIDNTRTCTRPAHSAVSKKHCAVTVGCCVFLAGAVT